MSIAAKDIIMASWRSGTSKQYQSYLSRWQEYCIENQLDPFEATVENGIEFLTSLFNKGLGYSAINTARSALSTVITVPNYATFGTHPLVTRFLKGVFEMKPSLPRYAVVWDIGIVLQHLKTMGPVLDLKLRTLTLKLTMLLCLLTGQRCQTITKLDTQSMQILPDRYIFTIREVLKTSKPGRHMEPLELVAYKPEENLCVVAHIKRYLEITESFRKHHTMLLISHVKPHGPVSTNTIGRWTKTIMKDAGIDVTKFTSHSSRAASTSYGKSSGLTLQEILKAGGWSNGLTFAKYYNKPIARNYGSTILEHFDNKSEQLAVTD